MYYGISTWKPSAQGVPVPCGQNNLSVSITGSEVQPKWSNPNGKLTSDGLFMHVVGLSISAQAEGGLLSCKLM